MGPRVPTMLRGDFLTLDLEEQFQDDPSVAGGKKEKKAKGDKRAAPEPGTGSVFLDHMKDHEEFTVGETTVEPPSQPPARFALRPPKRGRAKDEDAPLKRDRKSVLEFQYPGLDAFDHVERLAKLFKPPENDWEVRQRFRDDHRWRQTTFRGLRINARKTLAALERGDTPRTGDADPEA